MIIQEAIQPDDPNINDYQQSLWQHVIVKGHLPISARAVQRIHGKHLWMTAIHGMNFRKLPNLIQYQGKLNGISCSLEMQKDQINDRIEGKTGFNEMKAVWAIIRGLYNFSGADDIFSFVSKSGYRTLNINNYLTSQSPYDPTDAMTKVKGILNNAKAEFFEKLEEILLQNNGFNKEENKELERMLNQYNDDFAFAGYNSYDLFSVLKHIANGEVASKILQQAVHRGFIVFPSEDHKKKILKERQKILSNTIDKLEQAVIEELSYMFKKDISRIQKESSNWKLKDYVGNYGYDELVLSKYKIEALIVGKGSLVYDIETGEYELPKDAQNLKFPVEKVLNNNEFEKVVNKYMKPPKETND